MLCLIHCPYTHFLVKHLPTQISWLIVLVCAPAALITTTKKRCSLKIDITGNEPRKCVQKHINSCCWCCCCHRLRGQCLCCRSQFSLGNSDIILQKANQLPADNTLLRRSNEMAEGGRESSKVRKDRKRQHWKSATEAGDNWRENNPVIQKEKKKQHDQGACPSSSQWVTALLRWLG